LALLLGATGDVSAKSVAFLFSVKWAKRSTGGAARRCVCSRLLPLDFTRLPPSLHSMPFLGATLRISLALDAFAALRRPLHITSAILPAF